MKTAIEAEDIAEVKDLVRQGVDPLAEDAQGKTPVGVALELGSTRALEVFFRNGLNPNATSNGWSLLCQAIMWGKPEMVEYLIQRGADIYSTEASEECSSMWFAIFKGRVDVLEMLLKYGADPNKKETCVDGSRPLDLAIMSGQLSIVTALVQGGANPRAKDRWRITPIENARTLGFNEIATFLENYVPIAKQATSSGAPIAGETTKETASLPKTLGSTRNRPPASEEPLKKLQNLIGLDHVKFEVTQLVNFLRIQQLRRAKGLSAPEQSLHMVFTGSPGTGKTTIARLISQIYKSMGILSGGQFVETDRAGLVGGFLGQTAIKTQEVVESAIGGVLFIDEAYSLTEDTHGRDMYGQEAVATLLKLMEDHRDDLIVIAAGYTEPMQKFIRSNPGLQSRFNKFLHFDDYAPAELTEIFRHFAASGDYRLHPATELKLTNVFAALYAGRDETFGNGRLARNLFEKAINAHAGRMVSAGATDEESLVTLYPEDVLQG